MTVNVNGKQYTNTNQKQGISMKTTIITLTLAIALFVTPASAWDAKEVTKKMNEPLSRSIGVPLDGSALDIVREVAVDYGIEAVSVPATVAAASSLGVTASTGTAIATLSGAAATSATLAAIGTPIIAAASTVVTITAAPVVVGGAIVLGVAAGVAWGVNSIIDMF